MKVMKFGGAALRDGAAVAHVAAIVAATAGPRVVVVSAVAGVTDLLEDALRQIPGDAAAVGAIVAKVAAAHQAPDATLLAELERLLYGIAYTEEVTPRLADLLRSYGERLAVGVVAAALVAAGTPARALDAAAAGMHTLGPFGNARPDLARQAQAIPAALGAVLAQGEVPVVTGFYGIDADGHATLFGRGGSDYVAALVARALAADALELWKDVPGFLTADPKAVPDARFVPELDYDEAAELAFFGARLLHPRCVEPVRGAAIPIHIRSLADPQAQGSIIRAGVPPARRSVRSAASRDGVAVLRLQGPGMAHTPGIARTVFAALEEAGVSILNMANSQATLALLIEAGDAARARAALAPLVGGMVQRLDVLPDRALVCVVGRGLGETPGSAARILQSVSDAGVNVEMISLGASDIAIDFTVKAADRAAALRGIHHVFLEPGQPARAEAA